MSTTTRTVFYRFQILSDVKGSPTFVQHETKSALFLGDEQLTTWKPDAPTDIPLPLATDLLGAVNAALLARITELEAEIVALKSTPPPSPPTNGVSKLTLMRRLDALGKWTAFKALLAQLPETVQDAWTLAQSVRADDPLFVQAAPTIKAHLDLTDEQFASLLS